MVIDFATSIDATRTSAAIVAVSGEVDVLTAPEFKARVNEAVALGRKTLVIDFTQATFVDSSSLTVLIGAHRRQARRGGALIVVCDHEPVMKVFRITGLTEVFAVVPSLDEKLLDG